MEKEDTRKKKLTHLIKDFALIETTNKNRVPAAVSGYVLREYGLQHYSERKDLSDEEGSNFVIKLEGFLEERLKMCSVKEENISPKVDLKHCFMKSCDAFAIAKNEYLQVILKMSSLLNEIIQVKEKYSEYLKEKGLMKQGEIEILEKKLHAMKLQSLYKFYSENNSWIAHIRLKDILAEKLKSLQVQCNTLTELSAKYQELKNNKTYIALFQLYKQLLKREKKLDYMIEN